MTWYYQGKVFDPTPEELEGYEGFVYVIEQKSTGMKYIGQKRFWNKVTRPPLKGRKNKRHSVKESDWRSYFGSNEKLKLLVEDIGPDDFHREILHFCRSKGELSYMELQEQMDRRVLFDDTYWNGIINVRISTVHLKGWNGEKTAFTNG